MSYAAKPDVGCLNRHYDRAMFGSYAREHYGGSDFYNYGYWYPTTESAKEACQNLMGKLLAFIPEKRGSMLDVACGKGATTRYLLNYYNAQNVTGINISRRQLAKCKYNAPGCRFLLMNAADLSFEDGSFDNLICVEAAFQ